MRLARRRLVIAILCALLLVTSAAPVHAQSGALDEGPLPLTDISTTDDFFGIVQAIHNPEMAIASGARWERLVVWWSNFQPNGPEDWAEDAWFDRSLVEAQVARGITPVGVVLHAPPWAARHKGGDESISPPLNVELPFDDPSNYWGQFMTRLASEYAGLVDHWVVWNEPEFCWSGTVADFAALQKVAYLAIKKGNPNATVVLTGTTYWWDVQRGRRLFLDRLLEQLAADPDAPANGFYFDAVSVHQYGNPLNSYTVPVLYRRTLASYGLNKPLWLDESNTVPWDDPMHPLPRGGLRATMGEQASYVIQSIALARAAGAERYSIYKMKDEEPESDQFYGLVRNDGTPRPAFIAYQTAVRELSHVRDAVYFWSNSASPPTYDEVTALLASTRHHPQFVWPGALNGVRMTRGADRVTVLWNASAAPLEIGATSSVAKATLVDKYGRSTPIVRAPDGAFHLTLAPAENNTDARDPSLVLVGGDPVILVEPGAARYRDPLPREIDGAWGVPGALVPTQPRPEEAWVAPTGYTVSGPWLEFYRAHGGEDYVGYPRSPVVVDPDNPKQVVQYFQRLVLEWHPDNPAEYRIQRRLLGSELLGEEAAPPVEPTAGNGPEYWYFPKGENGLGHAVSNYAPDGSWIGFKAYFDRMGREDAFGYPMEPPTLRVGADGVERWTQRFQAAYFEFHQENNIDGVKPGTNIPWRNWVVQLRLLGDEYLAREGLPFVSGDAAALVLQPPAPAPGA